MSSPPATITAKSGQADPSPAPAHSARRASTYLDAITLTVIVAVATAVYSYYALRVGTFQLDESLYLHEARFVAANFPGGLFQSAYFPRGLQRLDQFALAIPFLFARGPAAFQIDRVIQCLLFASAAVPTFLLARRAGFGRLASQLAALLSIVVPWAVVSTSFLTESAAYPTYAWSLYAVWTAIVRPSPPREAFALLTIALAMFSRTAMIALAPMLPLAVLWQELRWDVSGAGLRQRARSLPTRLWQGHPLVSAATGAAVAFYLAARLSLLPSALGTLTGEYGVPHVGSVLPLLERYEYFLSRGVVGTGLVAFAIGLPWLALTIIRPRDGARHALAVVCLLGLSCLLLSLIPAGPDERYVAYAAVPIALLFVAGLSSRPGLGVLAGAAAVDLLIESVTWPSLANLYDYFTYPAAIFYQRVALGRVSTLGVPLIHLSSERLVQAGVLMVTLCWVLAGRRPRLIRPVGATLGVGVLALCAAQTYYSLHRYIRGAGAGTDAAERSWIDRNVPAGKHVALVPVSLGLSSDFTPIWETAEMWNTSVNSAAYFVGNAPGSPIEHGRTPQPLGSNVLFLKVNEASGRVSAIEAGTYRSVALRYVLVPAVSMTSVGFDAEGTQVDPSLLVRLQRLRQPASLEWRLKGTSEEGFMAPGGPADATIYSAALSRDRRCVSFRVSPPPGIIQPWPFTVLDHGRLLARGTVTTGRAVTVKEPLTIQQEAGRPIAHLTIHVRGSAPYPTGASVSARVDEFSVRKCTGHS
jgi:hypothetical protein